MLLSLELAGFKSFADRTRFEFHPGLTAVVGPNGSGKSNVVDAIKWILGDQSPKSLRGKEMTDVIFSGAAGRKASGSAEAILKLDNRGGWLPVDDDQITVGRRLLRSGDSEYLLNGAAVRLKDVRALFTGTGAGQSSYAIIEQGQVAHLLNANAAGRRAVFEEAAGVSRFRAKKAEAVRRWERVDQDLQRLTDHVDRLEAQLSSTRTRAKKAAEWRALSDELRAWWTGLAADEWRVATAAAGEAGRDRAAAESELTATAAEETAARTRADALEAELSAAEASVREAEQADAAVRERLAAADADARAGRDRLSDLHAERRRLLEESSRGAVRESEAAAELTRDAALLEAARAELEARESALGAADPLAAQVAALAALRGEAAARRESRMAAVRAVSDTASAAAAAAADLAAAETGTADRTGAAAAAESDLAAAGAAVLAARTEREGAERAVAAASSRSADLDAAAHAVRSARDTLARRVAEFREARSGVLARLAVLGDIDRRGGGFGPGVREILDRARERAGPPWDGVRGTVADLLDCDLDDAPLLAAALGERAGLVVVDDFTALVPHLSRKSASLRGRVGFFSRLKPFGPRPVPPGREPATAGAVTGDDRHSDLPTRGVGPQFIQTAGPAPDDPLLHVGGDHADDLPDLTGRPGVRHRADELVRPSSFPHLAARLLGDAWVVESLDDALALAAGVGRGCRFVTPAGEVLDADGTITAGSPHAEPPAVTRRAERRRLDLDLKRLDARLADDLARRSGLGAKLDEIETRRTAAAEAGAAAAERLRAATADLADADRGRDAARRRCDELRTTAAGDADRLAACAAAAGRAAGERDAAAAALAALEAESAELDRRVAAAERDLEAARARRGSEELELATRRQRVDGLRAAHDRLHRDRDERSAALAETRRRLHAAEGRVCGTVLSVLSAAARAAEAHAERDRLADAVRSRSSGLSSLRSDAAAVRRRLAAVTDRRRTLSERVHAAEVTVRDRTARLDTLAERIREEYGVDLSDLAAGDASAVALWEGEDEAAAVGQAVPDIDPGSTAEGDARQAQPDLREQTARFEELRPDLERRVDRLRRKLKLLGSVDPDSVAGLEELEAAHRERAGHLDDLVKAKRMLEEIIRRADAESKRRFTEAFGTIRGHFQVLFRQLFGGGEADVLLEDESDPLECGVEIVARPPGKELQTISLLSGGEKTMVCVGLLLAIFRSNPSPFCILDEVDAALDEGNIGRFTKVLREFRKDTQFLMITHRKPSMTEADVLYGVTMEEAGVSKRLSVHFEQVADDGTIRAPARDAPARDAPARDEDPPPLRRAA